MDEEISEALLSADARENKTPVYASIDGLQPTASPADCGGIIFDTMLGRGEKTLIVPCGCRNFEAVGHQLESGQGVPRALRNPFRRALLPVRAGKLSRQMGIDSPAGNR